MTWYMEHLCLHFAAWKLNLKLVNEQIVNEAQPIKAADDIFYVFYKHYEPIAETQFSHCLS